MNKVIKVALATTLLAATASTTYARSWRVNNDVTKKAHFVDINAAMASEEVQEGDTLYLDPNTNLSNNQDVTKQVTIVGTGWGGGEVSYARAVISGVLTISAAETKIVGLYITGRISVNANYLTMERCKVTEIGTAGSNCQYATLRNCYLERDGGTIISGQGCYSLNSAYWTIENCIFHSWGYNPQCISNLYNATINNNLLIINGSNPSFAALRLLSNVTVQNNIIVQLAPSGCTIREYDGIIQNNVISQDIDAANNYIIDNDLASVLTGDYESYTLVEGSPAIGGGTDGQDVGIFGGLYPYVANNGLPKGYPYYTKNIVGAKAVDGKLNVSLKVKIENE